MGEGTVTRKSGYLKGLRAEFKKIIWPKPIVLFKQTLTVIVVSLIVGAIVTGIDFVYTTGISRLLGL